MKTLLGLIYTTVVIMCLAFSTVSHAVFQLYDNVVQTYDELHRLTSVTYPSGYRLDYHYDPAGNLLKVTSGQATTSVHHFFWLRWLTTKR